MLVKIVFVALFASTTLVDGAADVLSSFAQDKIVPNVLETAPTTLLVVRYGDKRQVALGGELSTDDVAHKPSALEWPADKNALYTVIDVDAIAAASPLLLSVVQVMPLVILLFIFDQSQSCKN